MCKPFFKSGSCVDAQITPVPAQIGQALGGDEADLLGLARFKQRITPGRAQNPQPPGASSFKRRVRYRRLGILLAKEGLEVSHKK